jgi:hypothetical protein
VSGDSDNTHRMLRTKNLIRCLRCAPVSLKGRQTNRETDREEEGILTD